MKGQLPLSVWGLSGEGVELFGRSEAFAFSLNSPLFFLDHVHEFDTDQGSLCSVKGLEPQHRTRDPLHCTMVLFHAIVEILDRADGDGGPVLRVVALNRRLFGRPPVDGALLWYPMTPDRFVEKAERSLLGPLRGKPNVNGLAGLIHRAREVIPLAFHRNRRLVH